jgi:hypothetical protein
MRLILCMRRTSKHRRRDFLAIAGSTSCFSSFCSHLLEFFSNQVQQRLFIRKRRHSRLCAQPQYFTPYYSEENPRFCLLTYYLKLTELKPCMHFLQSQTLTSSTHKKTLSGPTFSLGSPCKFVDLVSCQAHDQDRSIETENYCLRSPSSAASIRTVPTFSLGSM